MKLKQLLADDDAVSPVIGVILMVAITVILAAVIGTFVLGLGDQVQQTAPNAQMSFDWNTPSSGSLTITHDGGEALPKAQTSVLVDGGAANVVSDWPDESITAGDSFETDSATATSTVRVVWESEGGDQSSTVAEWEGPDA